MPDDPSPTDGQSSSHGPAVRRLSDWPAERLRTLAGEYGPPLYVIDLDRVRQNAGRVRAAFPDATPMYAAKANSAGPVLTAVHEAGLGVECASAGELHRASEAGIPDASLRYTAVNPPSRDLEYYCERWRVSDAILPVTVGAETTLDRLASRGFDGAVSIRVNPDVGTGHHQKVATGADPSFGVPFDRVATVIDRVRAEFRFEGLHMHVGSGMLAEDLPAYRRALERLARLARRHDPSFVDVGGGFGVPYRPEADPLELSAVASLIRESFDGVGAAVGLEPGRYLTADAGVLLTRVNTVKETPTDRVVGVDAGLSTLVRPAMFGAYHPIRNCSRTGQPTDITVTGPICSSADTFCRNRPVSDPAVGDLLAIGQTGAYGYDLSSRFQSQPRPAQIALAGETVQVVRERETLTDLTDHDGG